MTRRHRTARQLAFHQAACSPWDGQYGRAVSSDDEGLDDVVQEFGSEQMRSSPGLSRQQHKFRGPAISTWDLCCGRHVRGASPGDRRERKRSRGGPDPAVAAGESRLAVLHSAVQQFVSEEATNLRPSDLWPRSPLLAVMKSKFDRFCDPGAHTLSRQGFSKLCSHYGCCPISTHDAFFDAFLAHLGQLLPGDRLVGSGLEDDDQEVSLSFRRFVLGAIAADPQDSSCIYDKAAYLIRFFSKAPRECFKFQVSLCSCRWDELRGLFLLAHRGGGGAAASFTCIHGLYQNWRTDLFRHMVGYL